MSHKGVRLTASRTVVPYTVRISRADARSVGVQCWDVVVMSCMSHGSDVVVAKSIKMNNSVVLMAIFVLMQCGKTLPYYDSEHCGYYQRCLFLR